MASRAIKEGSISFPVRDAVAPTRMGRTSWLHNVCGININSQAQNPQTANIPRLFPDFSFTGRESAVQRLPHLIAAIFPSLDLQSMEPDAPRGCSLLYRHSQNSTNDNARNMFIGGSGPFLK